MKRLLIVLVALVAVFAMVLPASAADLKFGGMFWTKWYATSNIRDGNDDSNDRISSFFYTRMRLYFTAIASENLRAVSKVEPQLRPRVPVRCCRGNSRVAPAFAASAEQV